MREEDRRIAVEKGTLIEFKVNGTRRLAVVEKPEGKKDWIVLDEKGHPRKIRPQDVEYQVKGGLYQYTDIPTFLAQVTPHLDNSHLEVAWELLIEEAQPVTPEELASLIFDETTPASCYAAHILLEEDKIYFRKKGDIYEPRPRSQVEEIKHQMEVEAKRKQEKELFIQKVKAALEGEEVSWNENDQSRLLLLEKYVLQPDNSPKAAQEILEALGRNKTPDAAFQLLVDLKIWSKHENIFLRRSSYPEKFPQQVCEVANSILARIAANEFVDKDDRLDLTSHKVYTIDDETTTEIDDGLSIEQLPDGRVRIWVHIADPTRIVSPNDALDLEARRRGTSLYLPTGLIPMFPPELATGPMSLVQGQICPALSFGVIIDENGQVVEYKITPSLVKPTYRLTYQDVDEMLSMRVQGEEEIYILAELAKKREQWRRNNGSIMITMPEAIIKVKGEEEVSIELLEMSPARLMVAEMMILAGEVAGKYCQENNIPVPFRGQPQPELPPEEELLSLPPGPVRASALRRCMPKSETGLTPIRHASLGLDAYTQVTSPIRRYTDLLTHFQLKAHLRGEPLPFPPEQLQQILYEVLATSSEASFVERQTNRYWSLQYFLQHPNETWQGIVLRWLREEDGLAVVLFEELGLEFPHKFDRNVQLGDTVRLQLAYCDPRRDEIRFREV